MPRFATLVRFSGHRLATTTHCDKGTFKAPRATLVAKKSRFASERLEVMPEALLFWRESESEGCVVMVFARASMPAAELSTDDTSVISLDQA
jgi:hypothetical protein